MCTRIQRDGVGNDDDGDGGRRQILARCLSLLIKWIRKFVVRCGLATRETMLSDLLEYWVVGGPALSLPCSHRPLTSCYRLGMYSE